MLTGILTYLEQTIIKVCEFLECDIDDLLVYVEGGE
jgi:DNA-binding Xre family transcriptional regulator